MSSTSTRKHAGTASDAPAVPEPAFAERARTLLRQALTHHADLPRADILTARIAEGEGDAEGALLLYLQALEMSAGESS